MFTLQSHLDDWDDVASRGRVSLAAYLRLLAALERAGDAMSRTEGEHLDRQVHIVLQCLTPRADGVAIEEIREQAEKAMEALVQVVNQRESEYREIISVMAEAGATLAQAGLHHGEELRQLAAKVESVIGSDSLADVRRQLSLHVEELRGLATRVEEDVQARANRLEQELALARARLRDAAALAETDHVTGLGNRRRVESAVQQAIVHQQGVSVLLLDLDGFKEVNDTYGHAQGDKLLRSVGHHLQRWVRESDLVCRWGGDEFVVVMPGLDLGRAQLAAARIRKEMFSEFVLGRAGENARVRVTASIGVAQHDGREGVTELLDRADKLMYADKQGFRAPI